MPVPKMITCAVCGKPKASDAQSCPHCGTENRKTSAAMVLAIVAAGAVLIAAALLDAGVIKT